MPELIEHLTQLILQDNVIFFVGNQFTDDSDQLSYLVQIANRLAAEIDGIEPENNLAVVAQEYQDDTDRVTLIRALKEALLAIPDQSTPIHNLLVDSIAPFTKIITTRFDRALESALEQAHMPYNRIISDDEVSFFDEARVALIKIRGDINRAESLVLTQADINKSFKKLPAVNDVVRAFFATKTMVFLGYDLNEPSFKQFFQGVTSELRVFRRQAYAIVPHPLKENSAKHWKKQVVQVHVEPIDKFLQKLTVSIHAMEGQAEPVSRNPLARLVSPPRPEQPYKLLDSFNRLDTAVFAGRRGEIERLTNRILAHPLTVLFGQSGNGKTSLLQAGVGPKLAQNETLLLLTAPVSGERLIAGWMTDLLTIARFTALPQTLKGGLISSIRTLQAGINGPVVLALDQFEQFFVAYSEAEQETAVADMRALLDDEELDIRLVLVVREDFLGRLDLLANKLPGMLDTRFRLGRLDAEAARSAIEHPVKPLGISWEQALVDRLLYDLQSDHQIAPPQLQIVCTRLYKDARERSVRHITITRYESLGGMAKILGDYVETVVGAMSSEQQEIAKQLLGAMVSSSRVKLRLPLADLARVANTDEKTAVSILDILTENRLTRRYEMKNGLAYELTHDYLVQRIATWLGKEFWETQRARELLRLAIPEWKDHQRILSPGDLRLVNKQRTQINVNHEEAVLIFASAASYQEEPDYWQKKLNSADVGEVLRNLTNAPQPFVRKNAAMMLAGFADNPAAAQLAHLAIQDEDPSIREATAKAIAYENNQQAMAHLVSATEDEKTYAAAKAALVIVRNEQTAVAEQLPEPLNKKVLRQVWRLRWQNHKQAIYNATASAAIGGFVGFGIAMAPIYTLVGDTWELFLNFKQFGTLFTLFLGSFVLTGIFGGLATASGKFVQSGLEYVSDGSGKQRAWFWASLTTGLILAVGMVILAFLAAYSSVTGYITNALTGFLIGFFITLAATVPLSWKRPLRAAITIIIGILIFLVISITGLSLDTEPYLLIFAGVATGIGVFWSFNL